MPVMEGHVFESGLDFWDEGGKMTKLQGSKG